MTAMGNRDSRWRIFYALLISNGVSLGLFAYRAIETRDLWFVFLIWNLFLAWIPLGLAWWLVRRLDRHTWLTPLNIGLTLLWFTFLPNSFYFVSDFIHIGATGETLHDLVMDVAMLFSFTFNAYVAGFLGLYMVHQALLRRIKRLQAHGLIATVLLASGFAIYLGRTLRWNTWDIVVDPAGLLFDISDRIINVGNYPDMAATTLVFGVILMSMYALIWQFVQALRND